MSWLAYTKLQPPQLRADVVPRPRLLDALRDALGSCALTLLAAPAGYGKTTLLAALPHALPDLPIAWLALDEEDNDPARFLAALLAAIRRLEPSCGIASQALLNSLTNPGAESRRIVSALINDIPDTLPGRFALVLDDLHLIAEPAIHSALDYLLDRMPPQMRLIVATRHDPPLSLARLRARGGLAELRLDDLSFTRDEMTSLLNEQLRLELSPGDLTTLEACTEGWAASLRLLASSLDRIAGAADRSAFITHLARTDRAIFDFLADEVLNRQEQALRTFLLQTAILPELTPSLCRAVTGRDDAESLLEDLYRRNLFLVSADQSGASFRYHGLFAAFLRRRLARELPDQVAVLHRRAAEAQTMPSRALGHYLAAELWDPAARIIEQVGEAVLQQGLLDTLRSWVQALPAAVRDARPRLIYLLGVCVRQQGDLAAAQALLDQALRGFDAAGDAIGQGEVLAELAECAIMRADFERGSELIGQALARSIPPHSLVQALMGRAGVALLREHWQEAEADFAAALALTRETGDPDVLHTLVVSLHPVYIVLPGSIEQIERLAREALDLFGNQNSPARMAIDAQMSFVHLLRGRQEQAIAAGERALATSAQFGGYPFMDADVTALVAGVYTARGEYLAADRYFDVLFERVERSALSDMVRPGLLYLLGRARLLQGRLEAAQQVYAQICAIEHPAELPLAPVMRALMRGRLELAGRRYKEAERLLRRAAALEQRVRVALLFGSARMILAHLYLCWNRHQDALAELAPLLEVCERQDIPGLILNEGALAVPLLKLAVEHGVHAAFATRLLVLSTTTPQQIRVPETGETLSPREIEVLRLIVAGASNRAIAERLVLSEQTIKSHVARILRKLAVSSRTGAAARARALGIVDITLAQ